MAAASSENPVEALLAELTLVEKIGQLTLVSAGQAVTGPQGPLDYLDAIRAGRVGAVLNLWGPEATRALQKIALEETRLRIPLLFALDIIHGHHTVFPIPLAEAAAFDPDLWQRTARAAAREGAADGVALAFAPMLDVARDPRWGRIAESPGEDPWLASRFGEAKIKGLQGQDLAAADSLAASAKHLAGYGAVTAGREYASVDVSERSLHEIYLPPFRAAIEAGVATIMPAFTDLAGVPMTANAAILCALVRERWGFGGVMVSDYGAIAELIVHGVAADLAEAAALALKAGVDLDLMGDAYARGLPEALERGLVGMAEIDTAVRRVLELKVRLGLFDDPYRRGAGQGSTPEQLSAHRALAREAACRARRAPDQPRRVAAARGRAPPRGHRSARGHPGGDAGALDDVRARRGHGAAAGRPARGFPAPATSATPRASRSRRIRPPTSRARSSSRARPMRSCSASAKPGR